MAAKPFSQACVNNRGPILAVLAQAFADCREVLEIGSGTGQHAVHFAPRLAHLHWQTSDLGAQHEGIRAWISEHPAANLSPPLELDVDRSPWPVRHVDGIFSANTCHIMAWTSVVNLFNGIADVLVTGGVLAIYGPFNYGGRFTADSNARFDAWLKQQAPHQGIRAVEAVNELAAGAGLAPIADHDLPANNRLLVWRRR